MTKSRLRPTLKFDNVDAAVNDIERLRREGYIRAGQWSLPQACWHIEKVVASLTQPATTAEPTAEQKAFKAGLHEKIVLPGGPSNLDAAPDTVPPPTADDAAVDAAIAALRSVATWPDELVDMGPLGPAPLNEAIAFHLGHVAHHLSFLASKSKRREGLKFETTDDVIADVRMLRSTPHERAGTWSLPQVCWHLEFAVGSRMKPGPHPETTPEQAARRPAFELMLASGRMPALVAPPTMTPPADAGEEAIDAFLATLETFKGYTGQFPPHRLFGNLPDADARRLNFIHCAHHLSYIVPTIPTRRTTLKFDTIEAAIAEVERLQKGHTAVGHWTLPQAAWHVNLAIAFCLKPVPAGTESSPEQKAMKANRLDPTLAAGSMPPGLPIAPGTDPAKDAGGDVGEWEVDRFVTGLRDLIAFPHGRVNFGPFGVVTTDEFRGFVLIHAANHLSNFIPTT